MTRLTALELVLLAIWLGAAILVATVVAPAAFRVLPSRTLAGALVGQVLPVIFIAGIAVGLLTLGLEARSGSARRFMVIAPVAGMVVACAVAQFVIGPKIEVIRAAIGGAVDSLDLSDPRRVQFGRLHAYSVLAMGIAMVGACIVLVRKLFTLSS